jgi:copper chaperone CopZ
MHGYPGWRIAKKLLSVVLFAAAVFASDGCRKRDIRRVVIQVPAMRSAAEASKVTDALNRFQPAVQRVETDLEQGRVIVVYDSMVLAIKNLEYAIAQAGLDANEIKAATPAPPAGAPGM